LNPAELVGAWELVDVAGQVDLRPYIPDLRPYIPALDTASVPPLLSFYICVILRIPFLSHSSLPWELEIILTSSKYTSLNIKY
jgi:hypothetical protein